MVKKQTNKQKQTNKNTRLPMQEIEETMVPALGREDPQEEDMVTHSSILAWRIPRKEGGWQATIHTVVELETTEVT